MKRLRNRLLLLAALLLVVMLIGCTTNSESQTEQNVAEEPQEQAKKSPEDTYPLVVNSVYLASEEIIDHNVILLIEVTNVSDEPIVVGKTDYSLRHKEDETIEFERVQWGGAEITLAPHETNILFNFQAVPEHFHAEDFDPANFQVTYTGMHYDDHPAMPIQTDIPEKYRTDVETLLAEYQHYLAGLEAENDAEYTSEEVSDPIRITAYQVDARKETAYIRVENLTDEDFYFAPRYVKLFDRDFYYEVDMSVHDSAIDKSGLTIPANGKLEYREFFVLSNDFDTEKEIIVENLMGVVYETEWPMVTEYTIYGTYEPELPADFTWEN